MKFNLQDHFPYCSLTARRPLFFAAIAFLLGLLLGGAVEFSCAAFFAMAATLFLGFLCCHRRSFAGFLLLVGVFFCGVGAMRHSLSVDYTQLDLGNGAIVEGRVERKTQKEGYVLYRLGEVKIGEEELAGGIFLSSQSDYQVDDYIIAQANLRIPERADYPQGFDDFLYCRSQNVLLRGTALTDQKIGEAKDIASFFHGVNRWMRAQMKGLFAESALAQSLVLGENGDLEPEVAAQFEQADIGHILSVSGIYLFFFAMLLERFLLFCHVPKKWRDGAGILLFILLLFIFGENTAVWRMAIYYGALKICSICWKQGDELTFLALAFFVTILPNPAKVYDLGVQYSYAAVFSLICLMPCFEKLLSRIRPDFLSKALASVLCLNVGLLPLLIRQENKTWAFSLLANLFVTLYTSFLLPILTIFTLIYGAFGEAVSFLGAIGDELIGVLKAFAGRAEIWKRAALALPSPGALILLLWFLLLFLLSRRNFLSRKPKVICAGAFAVVMAVAAFLPLPSSPGIQIDFLNADGLSAVIRAENGACAVVGTAAGRSSADYVIKNGYAPQYTICLSKEERHTEGVERLWEFGHTGEVLAPPDAVRVLEQRYGIACTEMKSTILTLSPRCRIFITYHEVHQMIEQIRVEIDGRCVCLMDLSEDGPNGQEKADVLYWEGADRTALSEGIECEYLILRIPEWGKALPVSHDDKRQICNLYEAGKITVHFGKHTRLEAMYGSG